MVCTRVGWWRGWLFLRIFDDTPIYYFQGQAWTMVAPQVRMGFSCSCACARPAPGARAAAVHARATRRAQPRLRPGGSTLPQLLRPVVGVGAVAVT